jgi:hypothetical protein
MKTVQPGFLAMAAGSERRRKRDRGKEDALTPLRMQGVEDGKGKRASEARKQSSKPSRGESARGWLVESRRVESSRDDCSVWPAPLPFVGPGLGSV